MIDKLPDWTALPNGNILLREDYQDQADRMGLTVPEMLKKAADGCRQRLAEAQRYGYTSKARPK